MCNWSACAENHVPIRFSKVFTFWLFLCTTKIIAFTAKLYTEQSQNKKLKYRNDVLSRVLGIYAWYTLSTDKVAIFWSSASVSIPRFIFIILIFRSEALDSPTSSLIFKLITVIKIIQLWVSRCRSFAQILSEDAIVLPITTLPKFVSWMNLYCTQIWHPTGQSDSFLQD